MKPRHITALVLLLLSASRTQIVATPATHDYRQAVPPTTVTGIIGVFFPKAAFMKDN